VSDQDLDRDCSTRDKCAPFASDLAVRVWGMAADGRPFNQNASLRNLQCHGAIIGGLFQKVSVGEILGLQCENTKARIRIVRTDYGQADGPVEIGLLPDQKCPWENHVDRKRLVAPPAERRSYNRHQAVFPIELRSADSDTPMRVAATDISGKGCYVETMLPAATGTKWILSFWLGLEKINGECVVRTHDAGFGMGIEFTGLDETTRHRLQNWLDDIRTSQSKSAGA
jgi:hypothetical protein